VALIVDTDVLSFLYKRDTRAEKYRAHLAGHMLTISFMTLAELERWMLSANWGMRRRQHLESYLKRYVIHPATPALCRKWAEVTDAGQRAGRPIATADAWIAATALLLDVALVTNNAADFLSVPGLTVISEKDAGT
jgi:predicted nucleic acid-binding protein